jgi:rhodanese-related sulfurtransferase
MTQLKSIEPTEYWRIHQSDPDTVLIDLSSPKQFRNTHAVGAVRVSMRDAHALAKQTQAVRRRLYLISRYGATADFFGEEVSEDGLDNVFSIHGGTQAWIASGLPTTSDHRLRECAIGVLEVTILIGAFVAISLYPELIMVALWAVAGFAVAGLAMLDDHLRATASRSPVPRSHNGEDRCSTEG